MPATISTVNWPSVAALTKLIPPGGPVKNLTCSFPSFNTVDFPTKANNQTPNTVILNGSSFAPGTKLAVLLVTDGGTVPLGTATADNSGNVNATLTVANATAVARLSMLQGTATWNDTGSRWSCASQNGTQYMQLVIQAVEAA